MLKNDQYLIRTMFYSKLSLEIKICVEKTSERPFPL